MKRIENFRTGDRAETLGVLLLQSFCAVAEIPREEDFGLMDAVATLLRREGRFLHAEDTFMVQIKSRTETTIEYCDDKLNALLSQDMSLLVAHVDLTESKVELHTLGIALAHPNINDAKGVMVHLGPNAPMTFGIVDDILQVPFSKPILRWTTSDIENREFTNLAFKVLKPWLECERWNRRYRRSGMFRGLSWETNAIPTDNGLATTFNPKWASNPLQEIVPTVNLLTTQAREFPELRDPLRSIFHWLNKQGVEADADGNNILNLQIMDKHDELKKAIEGNPEADIVISFWIIGVGADFLDFWKFGLNREGTGSGSRYTGSVKEIREQGFDASVEIIGNNEVKISLDFSSEWILKNNFTCIDVIGGFCKGKIGYESGIILIKRQKN